MNMHRLHASEDMQTHILDHIEEAFTEISMDETGMLLGTAASQNLPKILRFLCGDPACAFTVLTDICGVDYPQREKRFDLVYHLLSMTHNVRFRLTVHLAEKEPAPSATSIYPAADWYEREAFDLYGIPFTGHPDMRRILTDYDFKGHPLRKDFPLTGFVELRYDDEKKKVVYEPVRLAQEYRKFDFTSPWEGMGSPDRLPPEKPSDKKGEGS